MSAAATSAGYRIDGADVIVTARRIGPPLQGRDGPMRRAVR